MKTFHFRLKMTIDLGLEVLSSIVEDGIKDILRKFCGVGGERAKKRAWFKAIMAIWP